MYNDYMTDFLKTYSNRLREELYSNKKTISRCWRKFKLLNFQFVYLLTDHFENTQYLSQKDMLSQYYNFFSFCNIQIYWLCTIYILHQIQFLNFNILTWIGFSCLFCIQLFYKLSYLL